MDDPFDDDPYEEDSASSLSVQPLAVSSRQRSAEARDPEANQEQVDAARDLALWVETPPESEAQAQFFGNLSNRLLRGISRATIQKMTVRDRVSAARQCYDMRKLELEMPAQQLRYDHRLSMAGALPRLLEEVERRKREAMTVEVCATRMTDEQED